MFCVKCGAALPEGANFCPNCGAPVDGAESGPEKKEVKTVQFRCKGCGHVLEIDPDTPVLRCPLCGSSELIQEDKEVTVERIRSRTKREGQQTYKEVQKGWQDIRQKEIDADNEQETYEREKNEIHSYTHGKLFRLTIALVLVFGLCTAHALSGKAYLATAIAVLQIILCLVSILLGLRTIRERGRGVSTVLVILAAVLFFPYITAYNARYDDEKTFVAIGKQTLLNTGLSPMLPQIEGSKVEYNTNSDKELDIDVEGITYDQFDQYITDCKNLGYTVDAEKSTSDYTAYNAEGYYLRLRHSDYSTKPKVLNICFRAPVLGDPDFVWPDSALAKVIPVFEEKSGIIREDTTDSLELTICGVSTQEYEAYVSECKKAGFTIDEKRSEFEKKFEAYNSDGYGLHMYYGDMGTAGITVSAPLELTDVTWPVTGPATLLPEPDVSIGKISINYDWTFSIYLGNYTIDEYSAYVDRCISKGFDDDFSRSDTYFSAEKGEDKDLTVSYVGFNTIYISITDHDKF